jgi:hypothetical protein
MTRIVWAFQVHGKSGMENFIGIFKNKRDAISWKFSNYRFWKARGYDLILISKEITVLPQWFKKCYP